MLTRREVAARRYSLVIGSWLKGGARNCGATGPHGEKGKRNRGEKKKTCGFRRFASSVKVYRGAFLFSVEFRLRWLARGFE